MLFIVSKDATYSPCNSFLVRVPCRGHVTASTHFDAIAMNDTKKLGSSLWVAFKAPSHTARGRDSARLLDAAHDHAKVRAFDNDGHSQWLDRFDNGIGDLSRQTLLHLKSARIEFGNSRKFGQAQNASIGNVSNMNHARKWHHVMLAQGVNINVTDHDHFVVVFQKDGIVRDHVGR